VAGHDDEQHAQRHDDDVAVLQEDVGQVQRLQQRAVGEHLEEAHDEDQGQQHAVVAQMGRQELAQGRGKHVVVLNVCPAGRA
jgi:hypothetical protein